jgi:hypothetical protein
MVINQTVGEIPCNPAIIEEFKTKNPSYPCRCQYEKRFNVIESGDNKIVIWLRKESQRILQTM